MLTSKVACELKWLNAAMPLDSPQSQDIKDKEMAPDLSALRLTRNTNAQKDRFSISLGGDGLAVSLAASFGPSRPQLGKMERVVELCMGDY
ncbi:hypothetical protein [Edaphobacter aggregans]|uniref:hypothetical protein n=1 Tax=Edaphobacter aggregans TaxID=570835 RepID=UPI0012FA6E8A|nr:hypothetical protein [Edaphobacter aggregans]